MNHSIFLDVAGVADRYGLSRSAVYRLARRGAIPYGLKVGGSRRWSLAELETWEQGQEGR